jgi:hypothetical protein
MELEWVENNMPNIYDIIKRQISVQTRQHLNVDLTKSKTIVLGPPSQRTEIPNPVEFIPVWTIGNYNLQRTDDAVFSGVTPEEFMSHTNGVTWTQERSIDKRSLFSHDNILAGIQFYTRNQSVLKLNNFISGGIFEIYVKLESETLYKKIYSSLNGNRTTIEVPLSANEWTTVIITFYSMVDNSICVVAGTNYNEAAIAYRSFEIATLNVPTFASSPVMYEVINQNSAIGRNTIRIKKETTSNVGGYGLYRQQNISSGVLTSQPISGTLSSSLFNEKNKWITISENGTLNLGDKIAFSVSGTLHNLTKLISLPKNYVSDPIFNESFTHYSHVYTKATKIGSIKSDVSSIYGKNHFDLSIIATKAKVSLTTDYIVNNNDRMHYVGLTHEVNLLSGIKYNLAGYKSNPSRWNFSGGVTSLASATIDQLPVLKIIRGNTSGIVYSNNKKLVFHGSTYATMRLACLASSPKLSEFSVTIRKSTSGHPTVWNSPTMYADAGYIHNSFSFTPSITGSLYIQINVPATISGYSSPTLHISEFSLINAYSNKTSYTELFKVSYFDSSHNACSIPCATIQLKNLVEGLNSLIVPIGTTLASGTIQNNRFRFPSDCAYYKLGYIGSINDVSTVIQISRKIHLFVAGSLISNLQTSIFATPYSLYRMGTVGTVDTNTLLYMGNIVHLYDRNRQSEDGAIVNLYDTNVEDKTTYTYFVDLYDNSYLKNRSNKTYGVSITTGDTTAPKKITSYALTALSGGILHSFVTPTASDLKYVQISSKSTFASLKTQITVATNKQYTYSELTTGTFLYTRYIRAVDSYGNASASESKTCTPLPQLVDLSLTHIIKNGSGVPISPNENGWYNDSLGIIASIRYGGKSVINYTYFRFTNLITGVSYNWFGLGTGLLNATTICSSARLEYYYRVYDSYNNIGPALGPIAIQYDNVAPSISSNDGFWSSDSNSYAGYNYLKWNASKFSDATSGLDKGYLVRAIVDTEHITSNPGFDLGFLGYTFSQSGVSGAGATLTMVNNDSEKLYGNTQARIKVLTVGGAITASIRTSNMHITGAEVLNCISYVSIPSLKNTATISLMVVDADTGSVVSSQVVSHRSEDPIFDYYTAGISPISPATFYLKVKCQILNPQISDYILVGETYIVRTPVFSTLYEFNSNIEEYTDTDVLPWNNYIYKIKYKDKAGNISNYSGKKFLKAKQNYRDSFRNMLNNSSFERVEKLTTGTLKPMDWDTFGYSNTGVKTEYAGRSWNVVASISKTGNTCLYMRGSTTNRLIQNSINILPFLGRTRTYVYSFYSRLNDMNSVAGVFLTERDKNNVLVKTKLIRINSITSSIDTWTRQTGTIYVTQASVTHFSIDIGGIITGDVYFDDIQLEEKDSLPPTDYYDTKSVTADYLQGNLIRGHMIEADSINAGHIQAESIEAQHMTVNSVAASIIKSDTITTNELKLANAVIYLKDRVSTKISPDFSPTCATIYGDLHFCLAKDLAGLGDYIFAGIGKRGETSYIVAGNTGHSFSQLFSDKVDSVVTRTTQRPLICRKTDWDGGSDTTILLVNGGQTYATLYSVRTYDQVLSGAHALWSSPQIIATKSNTEDCEIKYYNGNYYVIGVAYDYNYGIARNLRMTKLTMGGTVISKTCRRLTSFAMYDNSFDITPGGTIFLFYTKDTSPSVAEDYIYMTGYNTSFAVVVPTIAIETYGGYNERYKDTFGDATKIPNNVAVAYSTLGRFIVTNSYPWDSYVYYKVINTSGTVLVGGDQDLVLTTKYIHPERSFYWTGQRLHRVTRSHAGDVVHYIPATVGEDSKGVSIGGRATYLTCTSSNLGLEDLLNRMT